MNPLERRAESGVSPVSPIAVLRAPTVDFESDRYSIGNSADHSHGEESGAGGGTDGGTGRGAGGGSGGGFGAGSDGSGTVPVQQVKQASYRDTPQPEYPESARRQGREGRVLLRVLVDEHGRSKQVEINSSSGSEALDRAAAEAIRHWRFDPARYGNRPIESWLRIPIEFRLTDATNG